MNAANCGNVDYEMNGGRSGGGNGEKTASTILKCENDCFAPGRATQAAVAQE